MLSNRITAKSLELNPASQAKASTKKTMRLFQPPTFENALLISVRPVSAMFVAGGGHVSERRPISGRRAAYSAENR